MSDLRVHVSRVAAGKTGGGGGASDVMVVELIGDAGIGSARGLEDAVREIAAQKPKRVVFDLADLAFISSLAMGMLVQLRGKISACGGQIVLARPRPRVLEALQRARIAGGLFPCFDTLEAAIRGT